MENKQSVCAVVVTFNRKELLKECLQALLHQTRSLDEIIVIDNASSDGTDQMVLSEFPQVTYVRLPENIGGAGGFYEGMKLAYEKGHDWIWIMDDDAEPKEDALERLVIYFDKGNISALAGSVILPNGEICYNHRGFIDLKNIYPLIQKPLQKEKYEELLEEIDMASFVGILVNKKAIERIGYPKKEFFIHHDDVEYCIRLRKVGKILLIPSSIIIHKEAAKKGVDKNFLGKKSLRVPYQKFWLTYYGMRNLVWLGKNYSTNKLCFYLGMMRNFLRSIVGILLFDDNKFRRIKFIVNAYYDGLKGNFDNEKAKKILYKKKTVGG